MWEKGKPMPKYKVMGSRNKMQSISQRTEARLEDIKIWIACIYPQ